MPTVQYSCPPAASNEDRSIPYLGTDWVLTAVILIVISLRIYSRGWLTRSFGSDDFFAIAATILIIGGSVCDTLASRSGFGRHCIFLSRAQFYRAQRWITCAWLIGFGSVFLVRTSVMLFTLRLLPRTKKKSQAIVYTCFALNICITLIAMVSYSVQCRPLSGVWVPDKAAKCLPSQVVIATNIVNGALACVIDISTALIPAFLLYKVKMRKKTKTTLDIIFALGLVTAALSIGRAATMRPETTQEDQTYRVVIPIWFAMVESKLGLILASAPALRQAWSYVQRTNTFRPGSSRQEANSDFATMRHRVNVRDWFWRGKRDPDRAQGLVTSQRAQRYGSDTNGSHSLTTYDGSKASYEAKATSGKYGDYEFRGKNFGSTDPENSPLSEFEARVIDSVTTGQPAQDGKK